MPIDSASTQGETNTRPSSNFVAIIDLVLARVTTNPSTSGEVEEWIVVVLALQGSKEEKLDTKGAAQGQQVTRQEESTREIPAFEEAALLACSRPSTGQGIGT